MGDQVPRWARTPERQGWYIKVSDDDGQQHERPADHKGGFLLGRNGMVSPFEIFFAHQSLVLIEECLFRGRSTVEVFSLCQVCDFEIAHKSASRVHACIAFDVDGCPHIVDLGSTHGTC